MLGWSVSYRQLKNLETVNRREKIVDYQTALRAEIRSYQAHLSQVDLQVHRQSVVEHMRADASYTPFIPLEAPHHIFPEIARDIHILPIEVIDAVVPICAAMPMASCQQDERLDYTKTMLDC